MALTGEMKALDDVVNASRSNGQGRLVTVHATLRVLIK